MHAREAVKRGGIALDRARDGETQIRPMIACRRHGWKVACRGREEMRVKRFIQWHLPLCSQAFVDARPNYGCFSLLHSRHSPVNDTHQGTRDPGVEEASPSMFCWKPES